MENNIKSHLKVRWWKGLNCVSTGRGYETVTACCNRGNEAFWPANRKLRVSYAQQYTQRNKADSQFIYRWVLDIGTSYSFTLLMPLLTAKLLLSLTPFVPLCVQSYTNNTTYSAWHSIHWLLFSQTPHVSIKPIITRCWSVQKLAGQSKHKFCAISHRMYDISYNQLVILDDVI